MEDVSNLFNDLAISAFSKVKHVNQHIKNVTLGPNSTILEADIVSERKTSPAKFEVDVKVWTKYEHKQDTAFNSMKKDVEIRRQDELRKAVNAHIDDVIKFDKQQKVCMYKMLYVQKWAKQTLLLHLPIFRVQDVIVQN